MALRPIETAQERVRTALHLLGELDHQLGVLGRIGPERYHLVRLLATTRRQLWLAVAALESRRGKPRRFDRRGPFERRWGRPVTIWFVAVAWAARTLAFVLRSVWRSTRAAVRLVYTVRAIWP